MNNQTSSNSISKEKEYYKRMSNKKDKNTEEFDMQGSNTNGIYTKDFSKKLTVILFIAILLLQIAVRVFVGYRKEYFHMDEAYSYGLMNYDKIEITNNSNFYDTWHSKDYYKDYFEIEKNEVLNFKPVYENQKNDVHPPLFYLLLRIASLFTVGNFSKWSGLILNMIIYAFSSIFIFLIAKKLFKNNKKALLTLLFTGLCLGALDMSAYIRMYELANLFVLISTYIHMNLYEKKELEFKDLITVLIVTILSSLTHYYTLIYIGVLFIIFVIKYIKNKEYKNLIKYISTFAVAAGISLAIFPYSINHIFNGYRGVGATGNFIDFKALGKDIIIYLGILGKNLFGKKEIAISIISLLIILTIYTFIRQKIKDHKDNINLQNSENKNCLTVKQNSDKNDANKLAKLILFPVIVYFVLVAKITPYKELRYMMPIISVTMIFIIYITNFVFEKVAENCKNDSYKNIGYKNNSNTHINCENSDTHVNCENNSHANSDDRDDIHTNINYKKSNFINPSTVSSIALVLIFTFTTISPIFTGEHLDFTFKRMSNVAERVEEMSDIPALYVFNENNNRFLDDIYLFTEIDASYIMRLKNANEENLKQIFEGKDIENGILLICNEGYDREVAIKEVKEALGLKNEELIQNLNAGVILHLK